MLHYEDAPRRSESDSKPINEPSLAELIRRISDGAMSVGDLSPDDRRSCVSKLTLDGFSAGEIATLMRMSERTVCRDRAADRKDCAIEPDLYLGDELLGEYHRLTMASIQRLTRLAVDTDTPPYARLWAEESISRCYQRMLDIACKLNYVEHGKERMRHQRKTDPGAKQRDAELSEIRKEMLRQPQW